MLPNLSFLSIGARGDAPEPKRARTVGGDVPGPELEPITVLPPEAALASNLHILSVREPWASALVHGVKDVENRTVVACSGVGG